MADGTWRLGHLAFGFALSTAVSVTAEVAAAPRPTAWLYVSAADSIFLTGSGGHYEAARDRTKAVLGDIGFEVRHLRTLPPPATPPAGALLVLDHATALDDSNWRHVLDFLDSGGSVVALGAMAVRDGRNGWRGWDRMRNLLGARRIREMRFEETDYVTLERQAPILPVGMQGHVLTLLRNPSCIGVDADEPTATWSGWKRQTLPGGGSDAATLARRHGAGRLLWFGFPLGCFADRDANHAAAREWLQALFAWLRRDSALVSFEAWPEGREAAVVLAEDTEHEFEHAAVFADALERRRLPATFFCVSDLAGMHPALVRRLASRHEIGSHTDDHAVVYGLPARQQRRHLDRSRQALEALSGHVVGGFRPPEEKLDVTTLVELVRCGYRYWAAGHEVRAMPEIVPVAMPGRPSAMLVRIPRAGSDDYELQVLRSLPPDTIAAVFTADLQRIRRFHGVQVVSLHTQLLGRPRALPALLPFLDGLHSAPVWVATAGEVANWWTQRSACRVEILGTAAPFTLRVANPHEVPVAGLVVRFSLPVEPGRVRAVPQQSNLVAAAGNPGATALELRPDAGGCYTLSLPMVNPGPPVEYRLSI